MFAVWTFFVGIYRAIKRKSRPNLLFVFLLGSFYGLLIEFLQFIVPTNRSPETLDFVADVIGSFFGVILLHWFFKIIFDNSDNA